MNEDNRPTISIKLKPYLQEYLFCQLNTDIAYKTNIIGKLLKPLLEKRPKDVFPHLVDSYEYIQIKLPNNDDININGNLWVSPKNQIIFEDFLEWHFKQLFYNYMNDKVRYNKSFKSTILQFCADHNFTFAHMNYDLLKKDYYRKRKKYNNKLILQDFVPALSPKCPNFVSVFLPKH